MPVPLTEVQWKRLWEMIRSLEAAGETYEPTRLAFIKGLALFHLGDVESAVRLFQEIEGDSERIHGRRRIIRSYLASRPDGRPRRFSGEVAWISGDGTRGDVYVTELRRRMPFLPRDFRGPDMRRGETLGEFHIAFNFLGPIADPPGHYRPPR